MNLIRDNFNDKKMSNSIITVIILIMVILTIAAGVLVVFVNSLKDKKFKLYVDKNVQNISKEIFTEVDGVRYVNVKVIAELVGYEYNNGEYNNPYQEDKTKCYVKSNNEIASFISGSNRMYKVVLDTLPKTTTEESTGQIVKTVIPKANTNAEYYELANEVKVIDEEIYASEQAISIGFNIYFKYEKDKNTVSILTLQYLSDSYSKQEGVVLDETCEFSNKKLLLYDMVLIKNSTGEYGIKKLSTGETILGTKYAAIKFIESGMNFIVTTKDGKQGISSTTQTKIAPQYDELKQLDMNLDLYLVKNGGKYGVINGEDQIVVYIEYDQIGLDTSVFVNNDIKNQYIIYDKYIAAKREGKWGILNINGQVCLPIEYDFLGCTKGPSITKSENNLLLVPEIQGIVVCKNGMYGLMTPDGSKLVPISLTEMYKVINSGVNTYYMTYNEQKIDIVQWVKVKMQSSN